MTHTFYRLPVSQPWRLISLSTEQVQQAPCGGLTGCRGVLSVLLQGDMVLWMPLTSQPRCCSWCGGSQGFRMHTHLCGHSRRLERMDPWLVMQSCTIRGCRKEKFDVESLEERPAQRQLLPMTWQNEFQVPTGRWWQWPECVWVGTQLCPSASLGLKRSLNGLHRQLTLFTMCCYCCCTFLSKKCTAPSETFDSKWRLRRNVNEAWLCFVT